MLPNSVFAESEDELKVLIPGEGSVATFSADSERIPAWAGYDLAYVIENAVVDSSGNYAWAGAGDLDLSDEGGSELLFGSGG